jgi:hypothetical protein
MKFYENLNKLFNNIKKNEVNEWYLSDFLDENVRCVSSAEAFSILKDFPDYIIKNFDKTFYYEYFTILDELRNMSDTNESFISQEDREQLLLIYDFDEYLSNILKKILK